MVLAGLVPTLLLHTLEKEDTNCWLNNLENLWRKRSTVPALSSIPPKAKWCKTSPRPRTNNQLKHHRLCAKRWHVHVNSPAHYYVHQFRHDIAQLYLPFRPNVQLYFNYKVLSVQIFIFLTSIALSFSESKYKVCQQAQIMPSFVLFLANTTASLDLFLASTTASPVLILKSTTSSFSFLTSTMASFDLNCVIPHADTDWRR